MQVPFLKELRIGAYILKQKLLRRKRYPLVLMLEPLFRCNLACFGCGKIDYPDAILNRRLSVKECLDAVDECGAPMVAIPGGEPLIHKEIGEIVKGIVSRKKFVSLCTNALLLEKKLHLFEPSPYLFFSVHLDGLRDHHDKAVSQAGVFDRAVSAIKAAKARGFAVNVNATIFDGHSAEDIARYLDFCKELDVGVSISPGYAYERAPDQQHFLNRQKTKKLFRGVFAPRAQWRPRSTSRSSARRSTSSPSRCRRSCQKFAGTRPWLLPPKRRLRQPRRPAIARLKSRAVRIRSGIAWGRRTTPPITFQGLILPSGVIADTATAGSVREAGSATTRSAAKGSPFSVA